MNNVTMAITWSSFFAIQLNRHSLNCLKHPRKLKIDTKLSRKQVQFAFRESDGCQMMIEDIKMRVHLRQIMDILN